MAGYTRQDTANNISNNSVVNADDLDSEFDGIESAFNNTTGHVHDGSTGNGAPITKVGPGQDIIVSTSAVLPKTTATLDLGSASAKYKDLFLSGSMSIATLTTTGNAIVGGTLGVTGAATFSAPLTVNASTSLSGSLSVAGGASIDGGLNIGAITIAEYISDTVGAMVTGNTESGIVVTYDDADNTLDFNVNDPIITLTGAVTGNATMTNLGNVTINTVHTADPIITLTGDVAGSGTMTNLGSVSFATTIQPNSVALGTDTTGNYVSSLVAGTGVTLANNTGETATPTISIGQPVATTSNVIFNNLTASGTLGATGSATLGSTLAVTGNTTVGGTLAVTGNTTVGGTLGVTGLLTATGGVAGNASTASKWATARSVTFATGDITGSFSIDGSANVSNVNLQVIDDSHNHIISNVDGLQTALDAKAELAGSGSQNFSALTLNAGQVDFGDWTITETAGTLFFATGGVNKMKLNATGDLTVVGNITAYGSV